MGIAPQVHDVSTTISDSCNCCDGCRINCCFPFLGRKVIRATTSDIRVVRTADEALQKNQDSPPVASPKPMAASAPVITMLRIKVPVTEPENPLSRKPSLKDLNGPD